MSSICSSEKSKDKRLHSLFLSVTCIPGKKHKHILNTQPIFLFHEIKRILLAINSSETRDTWIGCYNDVLTMSWTWVNGEAMSYSNFLNDNVSPSTSFAVVIMGISYSLERKWKTRDKNASKRSNIVQIVHILAFNKALTILNIN